MVGGSSSHSNIFKFSGSNKKVRHSEFEHLHNGPPPRPTPDLKKNFLTRFTYETFQKQIPYTEDLYETKEELIKQDYVNRRNQILLPGRPYTTTVRQRGTFYNGKITYGVDREFPNKVIPKAQPPMYGSFKHGDPAHKGYNKTIGSNWPYIEEMETDPVKYHPNNTYEAKPPVWRDPTNAHSTPIKTIHDNFRNAAHETPNQFLQSAARQKYIDRLVIQARKKQ